MFVSKICTPKKESFCDYMKNALIFELKKAQLYSDDSEIGLKIIINKMKFNSLPSFGQWYYNVSVYNDNIDPGSCIRIFHLPK